MRVRIPSPLHGYTGGASEAQAAGETLDGVLCHLDAQYPGLKFRIVDEQARLRPHIKVFVDGRPTTGLSQALTTTSEIMIVCALSGG